jgi:hypothetical protein
MSGSRASRRAFGSPHSLRSLHSLLSRAVALRVQCRSGGNQRLALEANRAMDARSSAWTPRIPCCMVKTDVAQFILPVRSAAAGYTTVSSAAQPAKDHDEVPRCTELQICAASASKLRQSAAATTLWFQSLRTRHMWRVSAANGNARIEHCANFILPLKVPRVARPSN